MLPEAGFLNNDEKLAEKSPVWKAGFSPIQYS
jgi:hypothetical protein